MKQNILLKPQINDIIEKHFFKHIYNSFIIIHMPFISYLGYKKNFDKNFKLSGTILIFHRKEDNSYNINHLNFFDIKSLWTSLLDFKILEAVLKSSNNSNECPKIFMSINPDSGIYQNPEGFIRKILDKKNHEGSSLLGVVYSMRKKLALELLNEHIPFDLFWTLKGNDSNFEYINKNKFIKLLEFSIFVSIKDYFNHLCNIFPKKSLRHFLFEDFFKEESVRDKYFFKTSSDISLTWFYDNIATLQIVKEPKDIFLKLNQPIRENYKVVRLKRAKEQEKILYNLHNIDNRAPLHPNHRKAFSVLP